VAQPVPRLFVYSRAAGVRHTTKFDDDDLLTTEQVAEWFGLSTQWVEVGRHKGYGPPFTRISGNCIRYQRAAVREWLGQRSHVCTKEYA
jgi:predicted DNA-binding transcriptional regulator AlpA